MIASITFSADGSAVVEIPDSLGELHPYRLAFGGRTGEPWSCTLTRLDPRKGARDEHRVEERGSGYVCTCDDFKYRGYRKRHETSCKHVRCAQAFRAWAAGAALGG